MQLAARELAHLLNNDLAAAVGVIDLLLHDPTEPEPLRQVVGDAAAGLEAAIMHSRKLQQIVRVETRETPIGPALDLDESSRDRPP